MRKVFIFLIDVIASKRACLYEDRGGCYEKKLVLESSL